jgi:ubiquitin C-terminal hydrolase
MDYKTDELNLNRIISDAQNNKSIFIVENGFNTCYISSLLMALFYKSSYLDNILYNEPTDIEMIYLQEIIKTKFIDRVRSGTSVLMDIMNEIRLYANICGWLNSDNLLEQQDVNEFYTFLVNKTKLTQIEIQRETISEGLSDKNDIGQIESIPFISLSVPYNIDEISIKNLLYDWMNNNPIDIKREILNSSGNKIMEDVKGLNIYRIMNIPLTIGISLNRFSTDKIRTETKIDINKKIKFHNMADYNGIKWQIHSIICHKGDTYKSGHYYSIIFGSENKWFIFNDLEIPSLQEVDIRDNDIMTMIKRECVFLLYTYDDICH